MSIDRGINVLGRLMTPAEPARYMGSTSYVFLLLLQELDDYLALVTICDGAPACYGTLILVVAANSLVPSLGLHLEHWQDEDFVEDEDAEEEDDETHQLDRCKLLKQCAVDSEDHEVNPDEKVSKLLNRAASCRRSIGGHRGTRGVIERGERD